MYKLGFEETEEPDIKLPTFTASQRRQGKFQKNIYFCFLTDQLVKAKAFDYVDHNKLWKIFKEIRIPDHMQTTSCKMLGWMKQSWSQDCWEKYQ